MLKPPTDHPPIQRLSAERYIRDSRARLPGAVVVGSLLEKGYVSTTFRVIDPKFFHERDKICAVEFVPVRFHEVEDLVYAFEDIDLNNPTKDPDGNETSMTPIMALGLSYLVSIGNKPGTYDTVKKYVAIDKSGAVFDVRDPGRRMDGLGRPGATPTARTGLILKSTGPIGCFPNPESLEDNTNLSQETLDYEERLNAGKPYRAPDLEQIWTALDIAH